VTKGVPVELRSLTRRFGPALAVDDVTFDLRPGEVLGLLGPNGAGKTTTMRLLTGYLRPTSGSVLIDGVELSGDEVARKALLGYMPETSALYPEMTVVGYLRFWAKLRRLSRSTRNEAIDRAIDRTNLGKVGRTRIGTLSHGYRQRVSLAQALLHDPAVLVLDEPTAGLDPRQVVETRKLVADLARTRTVLLSSHLLSEVQQLCERVVVLDRGRVLAVDTVASLTTPSDRTRLEVRVAGDPQPVAKLLRGTPGVASVELRGSLLVVEGDGADLAQRVSGAVVGAGIGLVEMRDVGATTLEDAYLRLVRER
jgi:ABC-2 type transport system ATP-binding protein